jgi:hypothetical protein
MRFEAREVKAYAEPVQAQDLRVGRIYFSVQFADDDLLVPIVEPLEFVGTNLHEADGDQLYFRPLGLPSAELAIRQANNETEQVFYRTTAAELNHVFEYERALDRLLVCAVRRSQSPDA